MKLSVIGIGNRYAGDDGVGVRLVERLSKRRPWTDLSFLLWEDTDALTLTHDLIDLESPVLIVDCADMGIEPGEYRCFDARSAKLKLHMDSVSTHGLGMAEAIELAALMGFDMPVTIFGVQPFDLSPVSCLNSLMKSRFSCLLDALEKRVIEMVVS